MGVGPRGRERKAWLETEPSALVGPGCVRSGERGSEKGRGKGADVGDFRSVATGSHLPFPVILAPDLARVRRLWPCHDRDPEDSEPGGRGLATSPVSPP